MNGVSWRNIFNLNSIFLNVYHGHENYEKTPSIIAKKYHRFENIFGTIIF